MNNDFNLLNYNNNRIHLLYLSKKVKKKIILYKIFIIASIIFNIILFLFIIKNKYNLNKENQYKILEKTINSENGNIITKNNNDILIPYINKQIDFCINNKKYFNKLIESQITLQQININNISYKMYIYKQKNFMTYGLKKYSSFEKKETINILKALQYYKITNNITNNKDIIMLDIGGNIGWYPSFLGRFGYSIMTFEPLETNYYIQRKNYCLLNKDSNVVIITKGINNEEKTCDYYMHVNNIGNGMIICEDKIYDKIINRKFIKLKKVYLTKLSNFIPYLSNKNVALIKIDIEGGEGKALESGIELITKYNVPFILIEFTPKFLKEHGTDPIKFIKIFIDNGYKISIKDFLSNKFISINNLIKKIKFQINCYFIHEKILNIY